MILVVAGAIAVIFQRLKIPLILGYLLAGFFLGPRFDFLPTITDQKSLTLWSELGLIFLMLGLGLHFRVQDLLKAQKHARTAVIQFTLTFALAYLASVLFQLENSLRLFFAAAIAITSTSLVTKTFEEAGLTQKHSSQLVLKTLIFEDVLALFSIVILSGYAINHSLPGSQVIETAFRFIIFLFGFLIFGLFLVPQLSQLLKGSVSQEVILLFGLGLCFLYVMIASQLGFSSAFGAFLMGAILAETPFRSSLERLLNPLKSLFLAVFFISIGMMLDPRIFFQRPLLLLGGGLALIFGKIFGNLWGHLSNGESPKNALAASLPMVMIGEFSLLIASMAKHSVPVGGANGSGTDFTSLLVGIILISACLGPFLIQFEPNLYRLSLKIDFFKKLQNTVNTAPSKSSAANITLGAVSLFAPISIVILWTLLVEKILSFTQRLLLSAAEEGPSFLTFFGTPNSNGETLLVSLILWSVHLAVGLVFLVGLVKTLFDSSSFASRKLSLRLSIGFVGLFLLTLQSLLFSFPLPLISVALLGLIFYFDADSIFLSVYRRLETQLLKQLKFSGSAQNALFEKTPWESHLSEFEVPLNSIMTGVRLQDLKNYIQEPVLVSFIQRGSKSIAGPGGQEILCPGDIIGAHGSDQALTDFYAIISRTIPLPGKGYDSVPPVQESILYPLELSSESPFVGKSLEDAKIRERLKALVVGIERGSQKIPSPAAHFVLQSQDRLWLIGPPG